MKEAFNLLQTYEIFLKLIYLKLLQEYLNNEIIGFTDKTGEEESVYYTVTDIQSSEDGSAFISEDPVGDGAIWYGYAGQNPMVYVDRIGLFYYTGNVQQSSNNTNQAGTESAETPSVTPQNQSPNITGYSNIVEVVPLYENLGDYNNAILKQGTNKKRSWFSINVEEPITKFIARNIFGLTPSDYVMLLDRTIVPMSESGTQFAYSERVVDCMSFCVTGLFSTFGLVKASNVITLGTKTTSGVELKSTLGKTTTVLGRYDQDTKYIIKELNLQKLLDFSGNKNGFNLLNTPNELYKNPSQFWNEYNKPFLDAAINRGDKILMATPCTPENLYIKGSTELTGYGREYYYLKKRGYELVGNEMIKVVK